MNSVGSKIVYECVSQRDLSNLWPDDPVNVQRNRPYPNQALQHCHPDSFLETGSDGASGLARLTAAAATVWKNPRYFRWVLTIVISAIFTCILGFMNSFGALYMCLREDLHSSATETGWVSSVAWSLCILSPAITMCYQRLGLRLVSIIGIVLCFIGLFASTFARSIWVLYLTFGLVFGVGINLVYVCSINVITAYYGSEECAMPTTLPGLGASIGMLICNPVLERVFSRFGWRMSLRILATIILVVGVGGGLLYRLPPAPETASSKNYLLDQDSKLKQIRIAECKLQRKKQLLERSKKNYKMLLTNPVHWMFCTASLIANMVLLCNVINLPESATSASFISS